VHQKRYNPGRERIEVNPAALQSPFVQTAVPIMFTILVAVWVNSKSYDSQNRRIDDLNRPSTIPIGESTNSGLTRSNAWIALKRSSTIMRGASFG
jgi:hypothetical protein